MNSRCQPVIFYWQVELTTCMWWKSFHSSCFCSVCLNDVIIYNMQKITCHACLSCIACTNLRCYMLCTMLYSMYNVICYIQCYMLCTMFVFMYNVMFLLFTSLCDCNLQCYLQCLTWVFMWLIGRYWRSSSTRWRWRWWREKVMVTMETDKTNNMAAALSTQPTYCYSCNLKKMIPLRMYYSWRTCVVITFVYC